MNNLFDYLDWRGDISFASVEPVNADYAVFCSLSYIPFDGVLPDTSKEGFVPLRDAAVKVLELMKKRGKKPGYHLPGDEKLLNRVAGSERFGKLEAGCYVNIYDPVKQEQFSAVTFMLPDGSMVVTFRGTDGTIVGWKEDFNMGFMEELPSQKEAVGYVNRLARDNSGKMYLCGHSKGGNLAMYAAAFAHKDVQERIVAVRGLDSPGFKDSTTGRRGFTRVVDRMETFIPQSSIVGLLLEHKEKYRVVYSSAKGRKQHNIYTWGILGGDFVGEKSLSGSGIRTNEAINSWITDMSDEKRMKLTDGIYEIIEATQAETLDELFEAKNLFTVMKNLGKMDEETKELVAETGRIIRNSRKKSL
ncbi:MAG: DUF2974 domain-containing protein [Lachnospiraceae bacterium]|nr:DUF2974 domain-containing protein [Lachnospiraceae bacterium]